MRDRRRPLPFAAPALGLALALASAATPVANAQTVPPAEEILGSRSALRIDSDTATVVVEAGAKLHAEPHDHAPVVTVVDLELELPALERRADWARVRFGDRVGWVRLAPASEPEPAPAAAPPPPPAVRLAEPLSADRGRLERALELLTERAEPMVAAPFTLYTDVASRRTRELCARTAETLAAAYRERYGVSPLREARFAVVIFDRQQPYREFQESVAALADLEAAAHAGSGLAALAVGKRTATEVAALLVHELTHLLNRQHFVAEPPPWLEEGMANDLAYCRIDRAGRLQLGTLGGKGFIAEIPGPADRFGRHRFAGTLHIQGPLASLSMLQRRLAAEETLPLELLLDLTWREFVDPAERQLRYVQSTFLLRYLLDALDGDRFRAFLARYQAGGRADAGALLEALDTGFEELTEGFERWVRAHDGR